MRRIKVFIVFSMRLFYFSVMSRRVRLYQLVLLYHLLQVPCQTASACFFRSKPVGKFYALRRRPSERIRS